MEPNFMDEIDCSNFFDHIDDLIDFPPENECGGGDINSGDCKDFQSIWNDTLPENDPLFAGTSSASASDLSAELAVPYEDIVQLEWLSTFVEDSFAGSGMTIAKENNPVNSINMVNMINIEMPNNQFQTCSPISVLESSSSSSSSFGSVGKITPLPVEPSHRGAQRARSKRPRPATFTPRPPMQLLSPTSSFTDPPKLFLTPIENCEESQPIKKKKKIKLTFSSAMAEMKDNPPAQGMRKCLHCEITKTPQWRTGPLGPKTLCNACGVRYKSGRLFPEYRPAASPTFVPALHSNSHKKVVEMRSKEVEKGNNMGVKAAFTSTTPKPESIPFVE